MLGQQQPLAYSSVQYCMTSQQHGGFSALLPGLPLCDSYYGFFSVTDMSCIADRSSPASEISLNVSETSHHQHDFINNNTKRPLVFFFKMKFLSLLYASLVNLGKMNFKLFISCVVYFGRAVGLNRTGQVILGRQSAVPLRG